jgi:hypothetical protein
MPDENFSLSLCLEACDMGKILSGATLCLAISTLLWVKFKVVVCCASGSHGNQNWCFVTEKAPKLLYQDPCDKIPFHQVAL